MYTMFLDFPNNTNIQVSISLDDLAQAAQSADYYRAATDKAVHVSVWKGGKCWYSTDPLVKLAE